MFAVKKLRFFFFFFFTVVEFFSLRTYPTRILVKQLEFLSQL